ncbi:DUF916 and DUF3324 domain-containing protein [Lacticaseibacillus chiayiensis]|uniref:DUF916 and DUF3324 domain-containing protein n=1 Tax=Lacticaseibacillus chiayiensis TaxID=2100821 RepID=UPI003C724589
MKKILFCLAAFIAVLMTPAAHVFGSELNFAAKAQLPDNQVHKDVSYFDIKMDRGAKQTLHVDLRNDTDNEVTVDVGIASATTNINGVVEYSPNNIRPAKSLVFNLKDYVKAPSQIKIPAKGNTVLNLDVTMPDAPLKGQMAGGITLKEHRTEDQAKEEQSKGMSINNRFSYVIGLVLQQVTQPVAPQMTLNTVKPGQVNYRNVISAVLENVTPTFINKVAIDANVRVKGAKKVLYKVKKEGMQLAPNTTFDFPIALAGKALEPGTYIAQLEVYGNQSPDGQVTRQVNGHKQRYQNHWTLTKQFTITGHTAQDLNQKDVTLKATNHWWVYALLAVVALLLIVIAILVIMLVKRKRKKDAKRVHVN